MSQTGIVKGIVKGYFFGALGFSAIHIIHAFEKLGLTTGEQYATPAMIDGIAIIGMVMRSEKWSANTRKIGLRVQIGAGSLSLAANVFAGSSLGGRIVGIMIVGLFLLSEWLGDNMVTRAAELAALAVAEAETIAEAEAHRLQEEKDKRNAAARARRSANRTAKHSAEISEARRIAKATKALQNA